MSSGIAQLDAMIARLKALAGPDMPARVAKEAAPLVEAAIKGTAAAGTDPLGRPWQPKKDGGRPLVNAAAHIKTRAVGNLVATTLSGPDVFHHLGSGHSPRRQILPDGASVPPAVEEAATEGARRVFRAIVEGQ